MGVSSPSRGLHPSWFWAVQAPEGGGPLKIIFGWTPVSGYAHFASIRAGAPRGSRRVPPTVEGAGLGPSELRQLRCIQGFDGDLEACDEPVPCRLLWRLTNVKKLYVGNLPFSATEDQVHDAFSAHGTVHSVKLINDRETGRPRGFGFVEMDDEAALAAIEAMDGKEMGGRALRVNEAQDRPRPGGGGGGGGRRNDRW